MQVFVVDGSKNGRLKGGHPGGQRAAKSIGGYRWKSVLLDQHKNKKN